MDSFQMIVLAIAVVVLIIILTAIGLGIRNLKNKVVYPPIANQCPDYWEVADDKISCSIPGQSGKNKGSLATTASINSVPGYDSANNKIDFTVPDWNINKSAICNKQEWANKYGIVWDGISNYNSC